MYSSKTFIENNTSNDICIICDISEVYAIYFRFAAVRNHRLRFLTRLLLLIPSLVASYIVSKRAQIIEWCNIARCLIPACAAYPSPF